LEQEHLEVTRRRRALPDSLRKNSAKLHRLLTTEDVSALLNVAPATIVWWRSQKQGPEWVRLGRGKRAPIRYRPEAIEDYIAQMESAGA
jgi:predicted transcriptional regulator of viral defense system